MRPASLRCWRPPVLNAPAAGVRRLIVVGGAGGTTLGSSFVRAAAELGIPCKLCDTALAASSSRLLNAAAWRLGGRTMPFAGRLRQELRNALAVPGKKYLLTTGLAPVRAPEIDLARRLGATTMHFSSDDPWNRNFRADWHFKALATYDFVFTPRYSNLADLQALGCPEVRYLPFGYDSELFPEAETGEVAELPAALFVGGADQHRASFMRAFRAAGGELALVGGYWQKSSDLMGVWLGHLGPAKLAELTRSATVNLILVREANRDGHTMRSFEAGAIGGCLLVQDTPEHRKIFGPDGATVRYFSSPEQAASLARALEQQPAERARLAAAVQQHIRTGEHTYRDRLATILATAENQPQASLPNEICNA